MADQLDRARAQMLEFALGFPGAFEDHPWGETAVKAANKKVFLFIGEDKEGRLGFSVKLPESADAALSLDFTEPTGYGLGASGWVSARVGPKGKAPVDVFLGWIEESFRAVAPKRDVKAYDAGEAAKTAAKPAPKKKAQRR